MKATPEAPAERHLIENTCDADPGSEGDVSQDPNWVPEHRADVAGPVADIGGDE